MRNQVENASGDGREAARPAWRRGAFTLMEMMVAIGILVIVMISVGVIFQSAGKTVGVSQASTEMLSNVRSIQQQIEADVAGMDKNAFLVIRSANFTDTSVTPNVTRRCDQISFISRGSFANRTGAFTTSSTFTDNNTVVPVAFIWWGQLAMSSGTASSSLDPLDPSKDLPANQGYKVRLNQVPTSVKDANGVLSESSFVVGRCPILLVPMAPSGAGTSVAPNGDNIASYPNAPSNANPTMAAIDWNNTATPSGISTEAGADITQSRIAVAQCTPPEIMSFLMTGIANAGGRNSSPRFEADHFCYRFAALRSPYDGTDASGNMSLVNGYFRMHPIALQGVSSFAIDWTDGSVCDVKSIDPITGTAVAAAKVGTTEWYGNGNSKSGNNNAGVVDPFGVVAATPNGDSYTAIFSYDNRSQWPVALRFRYHIADPSGRLPNGRDFVEVVKLPN